MTTLPFYSLLNPAYGGAQDDGSNPFIMPPPRFAYKIGPNPYNLADQLERYVGEHQIQHADSRVGGQTVAASINSYIIPQSGGMFAPEIYLPEPQYIPTIDIANQFEYKGAHQAATDAWSSLVQAQIQLQENNPLGASTILGRRLTQQELASRRLATDTVDQLIRKLAPPTVGAKDLYFEQIQMLDRPQPMTMPVLQRPTQKDAWVQTPELIGDNMVSDDGSSGSSPNLGRIFSKQEDGDEKGSGFGIQPRGPIQSLPNSYRTMVARGELRAGNNNPMIKRWARR